MFGKVINGVFVPPPVNDGNKLNVYKDPVWLSENGFHELTSEEIASIKPKAREIKLSKLSIIAAAGEKWPVWKARIEEAGAWDAWEAATYLVVGHPLFEPFWRHLTAEERKLLIQNCKY